MRAAIETPKPFVYTVAQDARTVLLLKVARTNRHRYEPPIRNGDERFQATVDEEIVRHLIAESGFERIFYRPPKKGPGIIWYYGTYNSDRFLQGKTQVF